MLVVHGDDFTVLAFDKQLDWFRQEIAKKFDVKFRGKIGPADSDQKSMRILNRVIEWKSDGIHMEADQRHAELIIKMLELKSANSVVTPGISGSEDVSHEKIELSPQDASKYRAITARGLYLSQDILVHHTTEPNKSGCATSHRQGRKL